MRLAFAGTPEFAARALRALSDAGHDIALVLTQPDRPAGRGLQPLASPVKKLALERGMPVFQPTTLKSEAALDTLRSARAEVLVVAAYGLLLPEAALRATAHGALNIHASLLPRWRGAAPIQRALLAGDAETGISIMQMDVGLDTGPVLAKERLGIGAEDDAGSLHDKLAAQGARLMLHVLERLAELPRIAQDDALASYARKIDKAETELDWARPAAELERAVRAFRPSPGTSTRLAGEPLKIWRARVAEGAGPPGTVLAAGERIRVACGEGALDLEELQRAGGRRLLAAEFLRGTRLAPGTVLGRAAQ